MPTIAAAGESGSPEVGVQQRQGGIPFADTLQTAIEELRQIQEVTQQDAFDLAMGTTSDLHSIMINSAMQTTLVETAVQLTSRAVSSYKEIMQMQI